MKPPTEQECRDLAEAFLDTFTWDGYLHFAFGKTRICISPSAVMLCEIEEAYEETNSYGLRAHTYADLVIDDALGLAALTAKCKEVARSEGHFLQEGESESWILFPRPGYAHRGPTPWAALLASRKEEAT